MVNRASSAFGSIGRRATYLVQQTGVERTKVGGLLPREEPERSEAVLDRDDDNVSAGVGDKLGKVATLSRRAGRIAWDEGTTLRQRGLKEKREWQARTYRLRGSKRGQASLNLRKRRRER